MKKFYSIWIYLLLPVLTFSLSEKEPEGKRAKPLLLNLALLELPDHNLQKARVKLTVTNVSSGTLVLDKELVVGFDLEFKNPLLTRLYDPNNDNVKVLEVSQLEKPDPKEWKRRFVNLQPGKTLERIYDLSKPIKDIYQGHWTMEDMTHVGFYRERLVRYQITESFGKVIIEVNHEEIWFSAIPAFEEWFGVKLDDLGLLQKRARSNTLLIK